MTEGQAAAVVVLSVIALLMIAAYLSGVVGKIADERGIYHRTDVRVLAFVGVFLWPLLVVAFLVALLAPGGRDGIPEPSITGGPSGPGMYRVVGTDISTGAAKSIVVEAASIGSALDLARGEGVVEAAATKL